MTISNTSCRTAGSTDGTVAVLESRASAQMRVKSASDGGLYDGINKGIERAGGEVIGLLHSDDVFAADDVIAKVAETLAASDEVDGVYGDLVYVSAADPARLIRYWRAGALPAGKARPGVDAATPDAVPKASCIRALGASMIPAFHIAADYEAMLRWLVRGRIRLAYIPQPMVRMRTGRRKQPLAQSHHQKKAVKIIAQWRRHGVGGLGTLLCKNLGKLGQFVRRDG